MAPDDITGLWWLVPILTGVAVYMWRTELTNWWKANR